MNEVKNSSNSSNAGNNYTSDPTSLTTAQILREVGTLKELLLTRIEAMEKAIDVAHEDLEQFPTDVDKAVSALKELHEQKFKSIDRVFLEYADLRNEKFSGVQRQFEDRDKRIEQASIDQKIAVGKSEAATAKQIDAQALLIANAAINIDGRINDVKDRLGKLEAMIITIQSEGTGKHETVKNAWASIGGIMGIIAILIALVTLYLKSTGK